MFEEWGDPQEVVEVVGSWLSERQAELVQTRSRFCCGCRQVLPRAAWERPGRPAVVPGGFCRECWDAGLSPEASLNLAGLYCPPAPQNSKVGGDPIV